jgi:hypothetical protein
MVGKVQEPLSEASVTRSVALTRDQSFLQFVVLDENRQAELELEY